MICLNCGRKLKSEVSRAAGYGPVCYKKCFGTSLRSSSNTYSTSADELPNYDIPGQMFLEDFLRSETE